MGRWVVSLYYGSSHSYHLVMKTADVMLEERMPKAIDDMIRRWRRFSTFSRLITISLSPVRKFQIIDAH